MKILEDWPYQWFGVWAEYGEAYQKCPQANLFVFPEVNRLYKKDRLCKYIANSPIVVSTSRMNFPNPFTGELIGGSISFRTDGRWLWLDDLADYIEKNGVAIPWRWLADIEAVNFVPPSEIADNLISSLQWPPIE